jgi:L-alanine-DL-glutamate epimerase-like enolase superfamily enzyme
LPQLIIAMAQQTPLAAAALEAAAHQLAAAQAGLTLAQWLHPAAPATIQISAMLGAAGDPSVAVRYEEAIEAGCTAIKVKSTVSTAWQVQLAGLEQLRMRMPQMGLRIDANGCWSRAQLLQRAAALRALELDYLEQPHAASDLEGLRIAALELPCALDETLLETSSRHAALQLDLPVSYVIKPMALGLAAAWKLACQLIARGRRVVASHLLESTTGRSVAFAFAQALDAIQTPLPHGVAMATSDHQCDRDTATLIAAW